ncbi:DNA polymerase Y family protein [Vibrio sp. CAIM 722]|uniref:DNA polymerase Y family protein n=1 Tax=Vibrio eleionomae TaxID=2653505 RepID=A0A7X4LI50_9VIBR|nr:DNA polymerase Y family protein [Vibrio eleionomae]MZI92195.1 DNA polymerase Y family protein [Vibrio eleionomae]
MQIWLYLHFSHLQLDTLFTHEEQPIILVTGQDHHVVQANTVALNHGIKLGMGLAGAATLCRDLQVVNYDHQGETHTLESLAQWLYLVTSDIVLFPPQGLLLKVSNMLSLYAGFDHYWQTISSHLNQFDVRYHYAVGFSPLSAMLLAKSGANQLTCDKAQLLKQIKTYPLTATELATQDIEKLHRVGIKTLGALLVLPMQDIARRFNIDLVNYVGRLLGQFHHPLCFYHPQVQFQAHIDLLYEIERISWLEKPLQRLLNQLEPYLRLRNQVAYELELILTQRDQQQETIVFSSARGDDQAIRWMQLCRLTLESLSLSHPVLALTLKVKRSGSQAQDSHDLFRGIQGQQSALDLIGTLQAKLGKQHVVAPYISQDPRPEKTTEYLDPTQPISHTIQANRLRPSLLYPVPQPLNDKITLIHGPERIATGWWDGEAITRDYFIAQSTDGRWLWVFRTPEQHWFVHGIFS